MLKNGIGHKSRWRCGRPRQLTLFCVKRLGLDNPFRAVRGILPDRPQLGEIQSARRSSPMAGFALSSFFVLFVLLLGLVAIATYQNYSNVTDTVDKEASSIAALDRDFNRFPPPVRGQLHDSRLRMAGRSSARASYQTAEPNALPHCSKFYRPSSRPRKARNFYKLKPCGSSTISSSSAGGALLMSFLACLPSFGG